MNTRGRLAGKEGVGPSFLTSIGVVPDDSVDVGFVERIGLASSQNFIKAEQALRADKRISSLQQVTQPLFPQGRAREGVAMPGDDRVEAGAIVFRQGLEVLVNGGFQGCARAIEGVVANEVLAAECWSTAVDFENAAEERRPTRKQPLDLPRDDHPTDGGGDD